MRARRYGAIYVLLCVLVLLVAGCGKEAQRQQARTDNPRRPDSVNASVGVLRLLALRIDAPTDSVHAQGTNTGLFLTVANTGASDDTLTAVSTVDAQQVVVRDGTAPPEQTINVDIPAAGVASMQYPGGPHLELVQLKKDVRGGSFMPVTFRFAKAGAVSVDVFVQGFSYPIVPPPSPSPSATSSTS